MHSWIASRVGHSLSVVSTLRGDSIEELLAVEDHTTGDAIQLATPGQRAHVKALKWAFHVSWALLAVVAILSGGHLGAASLIRIGAGVAAYFLLGARMAPRQQLSPPQRARLAESQALLAKKHSLVAAQDGASADLGRNIEVRRRLKLLAEDMANLDQEMYETRIARLNDAYRLLSEQAEIHRRLIEAYRKATGMIEIEIKSYAVVESISEDATNRIDAKIAELEALREDIQERERELAANEELERFLTTPGAPDL